MSSRTRVLGHTGSAALFLLSPLGLRPGLFSPVWSRGSSQPRGFSSQRTCPGSLAPLPSHRPSPLPSPAAGRRVCGGVWALGLDQSSSGHPPLQSGCRSAKLTAFWKPPPSSPPESVTCWQVFNNQPWGRGQKSRFILSASSCGVRTSTAANGK